MIGALRAIRCRCGRAAVFAVSAELVEHTPSLVDALTRAVLRDGWLAYPQIAAWDCNTCVEASDPTAAAFRWAVGIRADYLRQGLTAAAAS